MITIDIKKEKAGIILRWGSAWVGAHWSDYNRRWCLNIFPCVTIWWTSRGGKAPQKTL